MDSKDSIFVRVWMARQMRVMTFVFCGVMGLFATRAQAGEVKLSDLKSAKYVGLDTCSQCHEKEVKDYKRSTHARLELKTDEGANACETCHGPGSLHAESGGDKKFIINPRNNPETCFQCHAEKRMQFKLPYHHPVLEGKMSCSDCHELHGEEAKPWTATSMEGVNELCLKCHKDQEGPFVYEHPALREGCTTCHTVHGSIQNKMLLTSDDNLCMKCHVQANFPNIYSSTTHPARLGRGECWSGGCHEHPHGSNFSSIFFYP